MSNSYNCITKAHLVETIYDECEIDKPVAAKLVECFLDTIKNGLVEDGKVMISGFGVFEVRSSKERVGRNPKSGENIVIHPRKRIKFKPSMLLKKQLQP